MVKKIKYLFSIFKNKKTSIDSLNQSVLDAQYAVRGLVPIRAAEIKREIKNGSKKYSFNDITECNIGNPQSFGQKPVTFNREILAGLLAPHLTENFKNKDVVARVQSYTQQIQGNIGAYSESLGYSFVRESVSRFIAKRDGLKEGPNVNQLYLLDGASQGIHLALKMILKDSREGVMIPIPQYPLYTAAISLYQGQEVHYNLDESKGWGITKEKLQIEFQAAVRRGVKPKIIVIINPGNPTGQVMDEQTISDIIKFSAEHGLVIFADEVYQSNIYTPSKRFVSFNEVRNKLPSPFKDVELYSFHSTSKGLLGECGLRGGYMHIENVSADVQAQLVKLKSINLCSNVVGQMATELMVNPPQKGEVSQATFDQFQTEMNNLHVSLKKRAEIVGTYLNSFEGITCNQVEGALYAFPKINLPQKFIQHAQLKGQEPDLLYCLELLENTGICCVPGSGFGQEENTYHFRITTLILPEEHLKNKMEDFKRFNSEFFKQWK